MCMKGPLRELIQIGAQRVRIAVPEGVRATRVSLLTAGAEARASRDGDALVVDVPSILDHEVVAVDLA